MFRYRIMSVIASVTALNRGVDHVRPGLGSFADRRAGAETERAEPNVGIMGQCRVRREI